MKRSLIVIIVMVLALLGLIMFSCSGSGGNSGFLPLTGKIALYLTGEPSLDSQATGTDNLSLYSQVTATIARVQLRNSGAGSSCDVMTEPLALNLANLSAVLQFMNEAQCPAGPYNRVHIELDKAVQLMTGPSGTVFACSFEPFKNENGNKPDALHCDPDGICTLDLNGAVNVAALKGEKMGLDFDLKNFNVTQIGTPDCAVTMKASPITPAQMRGHFRQEEVITGLVSRLSTTDKSFDLTRGSRTFSVLYSGVTTSEQPGVDELLLRAEGDQLRTKVFTAAIDLAGNKIDATSILVKAEGTAELVTNATFSVSSPAGTRLPVAYNSGTVEGILADGVWVDVKLFGFSALDNIFFADRVEVEKPGTMTED